MAERLALLIGNKTFDNIETFPNLRTPTNDAQNLARVLREYGDFKILDTLIDENVETINRAIDDLFSGVERGNLVLLYYSGHGYRDRNGQHYLIAKNSRPDRLRSTAISGTFIHDVMSDSRSRHQIIILDCCFSGAFIKGRKSGVEPLVLDELKGEGTAILASSGKIQYSFEETGQNSLFTQQLLLGIETGEADEDTDGHISIDELFYYSAKRVSDVRPEQTPMIKLSVREGEILIAKNPRIAALERNYHELQESITKQEDWSQVLALTEGILAIKSDFKDVSDLKLLIEAEIALEQNNYSEVILLVEKVQTTTGNLVKWKESLYHNVRAKIPPGDETLWRYSGTILLIRHLVYRVLMVMLLGALLAIPVIIIRLPSIENQGAGYLAFAGLTAALGGVFVNGVAATNVTLLEFKFPHWSHWKRWSLFLLCQLLFGLGLGVLVALLHSTGWFKLFDQPQTAVVAGLTCGLFAGIALYLSLPPKGSQSWWRKMKPSLMVGSTVGLILATLIFGADRMGVIHLSEADVSFLWLEFMLYFATLTTTFAFGIEVGDRLLARMSPPSQLS